MALIDRICLIYATIYANYTTYGEQMLSSYSSQKWAQPLMPLCIQMVLLICDIDF